MSARVGGRAKRFGWALAWAGLAIGWAMAQGESNRGVRREASKYLPNAIWVDATVLSGGMPAGKPAFDELAQLGIKTVISVDGIKPDVQAAEEAGLRYVHLPHGYDGISEERLMQLAKAVRDLPGPVYIHCHHGKHRSPAAAAAVCISLGKIEPSAGPEILRMAGTHPGFRGLVQAVERASPIPSSRLDALQMEWVSNSEVPPIVETMVAMDSIMDRIKEYQQGGRTGSFSEAATDALMLKEHYIELHRSESEKKQEAEFLELLQQGRALAERLENGFSCSPSELSSEEPSLPGRVVKQLSDNCSQCHRQYRDNR